MSATISPAAPPAGFRELRSWSLDTTEDLTRLRDSMYQLLPRRERPRLGDSSESLVLVASELATNALRHGRAPAQVRLSTNGRELLLDVIDLDPDAAPQIPAARPAGQGGFGLVLATRLARTVGWYSAGSAKHVWALFTVDDADRLVAS